MFLSEIKTDKGHDSLLVDEEISQDFKRFMNSMHIKFKNEKEFKVIADLLPKNVRVQILVVGMVL